MSHQRIKSFDALKGMMIFLVVLGHLSLFSYKISPQPITDRIFTLFHVPVFFFVSGMFFGIDKKDTISKKTKYILKKGIYLILPTIFFYFLYYNSHGLNPMAFISGGFALYWFLPVLYFSMFILFLLELIPFGNKNLANDILMLFSVLVFLLLSIKVPVIGEFMGWIDFHHLALYYPFMAMGYLYRKHKTIGHKVISNDYIILSAFVLTTISFFNIPLPMWELRWLMRKYLLTFICLSSFFYYQEHFEKDNWFNNFFAFVGKYTLPIYVLHYFFLPDLAWLRKIMGDDSTVLVYLILIVIAVAIICLCLIFTKVISRSDFIGHYLLGQKSDRFKY